jgi:hypothetical protein
MYYSHKLLDLMRKYNLKYMKQKLDWTDVGLNETCEMSHIVIIF